MMQPGMMPGMGGLPPFPYKNVRYATTAISLLGTTIITLGVQNVLSTYFKYKDGVTSCTAPYCMDSYLLWTWLAVGVWGGVPIFITGFLGGKINQKEPLHKIKRYRFWVQLFAFGCIIAFCPLIIALSAVEVSKGNNVYYNFDAGTTVIPVDTAKMALPLVCAILAGVALLACAYLANILIRRQLTSMPISKDAEDPTYGQTGLGDQQQSQPYGGFGSPAPTYGGFQQPTYGGFQQPTYAAPAMRMGSPYGRYGF